MKIITAASFVCICLQGIPGGIQLAEGSLVAGKCMSFESSLSATDIVEQILKDPTASIEFRNVKASHHECFKQFTHGHVMGVHETTGAYLVPDEGVLLSTGKPEDFCWSDSDRHSFQWGVGGDEDLTLLAAQNLSEIELPYAGPKTAFYDACELEFEFRCNDGATQILSSYMFGSEEYFEDDITGEYSDAFALFLNGENIALLPNGDTVSIENVNSDTNAEYFVDNSGDAFIGHPYPTIEADGFTTKLGAVGTLNSRPTAWNTMKFIIADKADNILDSYLLLPKGSFTCAVGFGPEPTEYAGSTSPHTKPPPTKAGGIRRSSPSDGVGDTVTLPSVAPKKWYPNLNDPKNPYVCVYGSNYDDWMELPSLKIPYLFDSEEDCCSVQYCEEAMNSNQ